MTRRAIQTGVVLTLLIVAMFAPRMRAQGTEDKERTSKDHGVVSETQSGNQLPPAVAPSQPSSIGLFSDRGKKFSETRFWYLFLKNMALDQKAIWTSSTHLRLTDANWLVPIAGITAAFVASDNSISHSLPHSPSFVNKGTTFSNYGVVSLGSAVGGLYLWGRITHDDHKRETGLLSGEAAVDALAVTSVLQFALGRQRPQVGNSGGEFWHGGTSFPSDHSAAAWAMASVIAHEYPGLLTKLLVYGLAGAVSASRVTGRDHFPSDVLVGSAIGWFVGQQVYRTHHDPDLGGGAWSGTDNVGSEEQEKNPYSLASVFVPLDSWIYPAFERLSDEGYLTTAIMGMKPWTRIECARLVEEAGEAMTSAVTDDGDSDEEAIRTQKALETEFTTEIDELNGTAHRTFLPESVYTRAVSISGPPLTDGYHFGQTISYDFGRPFRRGTNVQAGGSFRASWGSFALYVRAEYQHAPSAPPLSDAVRSVIASVDQMPVQPATPFQAVNRPILFDAYLTYNLQAWQFSFGKQSLDWGIGEGGGMLFSDNAAPLLMARITRTVPTNLPGFLSVLGQMRTEFFIGQMEGGTLIPHPLLYGYKVSFKVRHDLEIGYGRTSILGKGGSPNGDSFTWANFFHSFFGWKYTTIVPGNHIIGVPGDQRDSLDFIWHLPRTRNAISLYAELYADDKPVMIVDPPRGAYRWGVYISRIPKLPRLDFRVEGTSTESPSFPSRAQTPNYFNSEYRDGYTNYGMLMGNTVGREGRAYQVWSTYHFSPKHTLEFSLKDSRIDPGFIGGGGDWQDFSARDRIVFHSGLYVNSFIQFEHIRSFPLLFSGSVNNVTATLELGVFLDHLMR
jgi:membrane-associated phospholipid phosphatase